MSATCVAAHVPPRAVSIPRSFRADECPLLALPTVAPTTAFSPFSPVQKADLERVLRVGSGLPDSLDTTNLGVAWKAVFQIALA